MIKLTILGAAMSLALIACGNQADNRDQMTDDSFDGAVTEESVLITVPEDMTQPPEEAQPSQPSMPEQPQSSQPSMPEQSQPSMDMNNESMDMQDQQSLYVDDMSLSAADPAMAEALSNIDLFAEEDNSAN